MTSAERATRQETANRIGRLTHFLKSLSCACFLLSLSSPIMAQKNNLIDIGKTPHTTKLESSKPVDLKIEFGKVSKNSIFVSETWSHWGGSVVKGNDGLYHMLYSRWPKKLGWSWVVDSEIAHAVGPTPFGPFKHQAIATPRRGKDHWDGWCTHNPTVHKFGDKYYLYYMGNTGDGEIVGSPGKQRLNWQHRNNQRIGVAIADNPAGPWTRMDEPVLDISRDDSASDALMTSNPSVCQRTDGSILMVYKAVGKKFKLPAGGPVVHMVAIADQPTNGTIQENALPRLYV